MSDPIEDLSPIHDPLADPSGLSLDELSTAIRLHAGHLAAGSARWLSMISEFDRRRGWEKAGMVSCAAWLAWQCALSPAVARDHIRIAHMLQTLPLTRAQFESGTLSFSKVRAICRTAEPDTEADLLDLARNATAGQLETICSAWRVNRESYDRQGASERHAKRSITWRTDKHGNDVGTIVLPPEESKRVRAVLDDIADDLRASEVDVDPDRPQDRPTVAQRRADALIHLVDDACGPTVVGRGDRTLAVIEADIEVLRDDDPSARCRVRNGPALLAESARRLTCDCTIELHLIGEGDGWGKVQHPPVRLRAIPRAVRRALERRDKGVCQFPGCCTTRWVDAHHIVHWARGGEHELENLVTLCRRHHHLVHEGGFVISTDGSSIAFARPDGTSIETAPALGGDAATLWAHNQAGGASIGPDTLLPGIGEPFDLDLTICALGSRHPYRPRVDHCDIDGAASTNDAAVASRRQAAHDVANRTTAKPAPSDSAGSVRQTVTAGVSASFGPFDEALNRRE